MLCCARCAVHALGSIIVKCVPYVGQRVGGAMDRTRLLLSGTRVHLGWAVMCVRMSVWCAAAHAHAPPRHDISNQLLQRRPTVWMGLAGPAVVPPCRWALAGAVRCIDLLV